MQASAVARRYIAGLAEKVSAVSDTVAADSGSAAAVADTALAAAGTASADFGSGAAAADTVAVDSDLASAVADSAAAAAGIAADSALRFAEPEAARNRAALGVHSCVAQPPQPRSNKGTGPLRPSPPDAFFPRWMSSSRVFLPASGRNVKNVNLRSGCRSTIPSDPAPAHCYPAFAGRPQQQHSGQSVARDASSLSLPGRCPRPPAASP